MSGTDRTHRPTGGPEQEDESLEQIKALFNNNVPAITCIHRTMDTYPIGAWYEDQYGIVCIDDDVTADLTLHVATYRKEEDSDVAYEGDSDISPSLIYFMCRRIPNNSSYVYIAYKNGVAREQFNFVGTTMNRLLATGTIEVKSWKTLNSMRDAPIGGNVDFSNIEYYRAALSRTESTHDHIAEAFGAGQCQGRLSLFPTPESRITERFLTDLCAHTRLTELAVYQLDDETDLPHVEMVAQLLRAGTSLQHLVLQGYKFDDDRMKCLIDALQHGNSLVTKLSLIACDILYDSEVYLIRFMRSLSPATCSLRELHLDGDIHMFGQDKTIGQVVGEMLTGSKLDAISLVGPATIFDLAGLCKIMKKRAKLMKFSQLTLHDCGEGISPLSRCLPYLSNLRTLIWNDTLAPRPPGDFYGATGREERGRDYGSRKFMKGIRRNGSLTTITVEPKGRMDYFATLDYNKIQMYCQRNEQLPTMLKSPPFLPLVPMLFAIAKQVDKTSHNTLLLSLLTMSTNLRGSTKTAKGKRSRCT